MIARFGCNALKFVLSSVLTGLGALLLLFNPTLLDPEVLAMAGVLLLLAAIPWIDFGRPSRALGFVCICLSIGFFVFGFKTLAGQMAFPRECSVRRFIFCELMNFLHQVGGNVLAAVPWLLFAVGFLVGSTLLIFRSVRPPPGNDDA